MTDQDLLQAVLERTKKAMGADALRDVWNDDEEARRKMREYGLNANQMTDEQLRRAYNGLGNDAKAELTQAYIEALENHPARQKVSLAKLDADLPAKLDEAQEGLLLAALRATYGDAGLARAEKANSAQLDRDVQTFYSALVSGEGKELAAVTGKDPAKSISNTANMTDSKQTNSKTTEPTKDTADLSQDEKLKQALEEQRDSLEGKKNASGNIVMDEKALAALEKITRKLADKEGELSGKEHRQLKRELKKAGINQRDVDSGWDKSAGSILRAMEKYDAAMENYNKDADLTTYFKLDDDVKGRPQLVKREEAFEGVSTERLQELEAKARKYTEENLDQLDAKMDRWDKRGKQTSAEAVTAFTSEVYGELKPKDTPEVEKEGKEAEKASPTGKKRRNDDGNMIIRGN